MTQTADLDWQDATLPPQPSRAQRQKQLLDEKYARTLAKEQAKRDAAKDDAPAEPLLRLAEALERVRESILPLPGARMTAEERIQRGEIAARQREVLHDQRRAITAAVLRGQLDPQQAGAASKLIDGCVDDVKWFAERLARDDWGDRQRPVDEANQPAIPVKDLLQAAFDLAKLHGIEMAPRSVIEGESRVLSAPDAAKPSA